MTTANATTQLSELQEQDIHIQRLIGVEHGAIHALAQQLPEVNTLLETSFEDISGTFMQIASQISSYREQVEAEELSDEARSALDKIAQGINANITKIIMGLQFQDRVSQNLVITINVLNDLLEEWPEDESSDARDLAFAQSVLEKMKLGEFRQRYLDYLLEHNLIDDPASIGFQSLENSVSSASDSEDDIDLF